MNTHLKHVSVAARSEYIWQNTSANSFRPVDTKPVAQPEDCALRLLPTDERFVNPVKKYDTSVSIQHLPSSESLP